MMSGDQSEARLSALRHVHYIAAPDQEPPCGDRQESVTTNPNNVGCPRCLGHLRDQEKVIPRARKRYTAVSMEPDAAQGLRAIRRHLAAKLGADITTSEAVLIAERLIIGQYEMREAARLVLDGRAA